MATTGNDKTKKSNYWKDLKSKKKGGGSAPAEKPESTIEKSDSPAIPSSKPKISRSVPKAPAIESSKLQNDPLWEEYGIDDFGGLTPARGNDRFAISFEGFVPLVERVYDVLCAKDRTFGKFVSRSMFIWYNCQHLYSRIVSIRNDEGIAEIAEVRFLDEVNNQTFLIPATIETYLKSIGHISDADGGRFRITFPAFPNANGHFDRVGPNTHWKYETLPAPIVVSGRLVADLNYSIAPADGRDWNIPAAIRPAEEGCGTPTKNLLGWDRATNLTTEQRQVMETCGITAQDFPVDRPMFQSNRALFTLISNHVNNASRSMKMSPCNISSVEGSFGLILYLERDVRADFVFNRTVQYSEADNSRAVCASQVDKRFVQGAMIIATRVSKLAISGIHSYVCFDFGQYANVPDEWVETSNTIFTYGRQVDWNRCKFSSAYGSKEALRIAWIKKSISSDNK